MKNKEPKWLLIKSTWPQWMKVETTWTKTNHVQFLSLWGGSPSPEVIGLFSPKYKGKSIFKPIFWRF